MLPQRRQQVRLLLHSVILDELAEVERTIAPLLGPRSRADERRERAFLREVGRAYLSKHDLQGRDALEPTEHDVFCFGMRDQPEPDTIERHPEVPDRRVRVEQLRQLQLKVVVITTEERDEFRRHGAHECSADAETASGLEQHNEIQDALRLTFSRRR